MKRKSQTSRTKSADDGDFDEVCEIDLWSKPQFHSVVESAVLAGATKEQIAKATGATRSTVVRWISGEVCPHPRMREPVIRAITDLRDKMRPEVQIVVRVEVIEEKYVGKLCRDRHVALMTEATMRQEDLPRVLEQLSKLKATR